MNDLTAKSPAAPGNPATLRLRNAEAVDLARLPVLPMAGFQQRLMNAVDSGAAIAALFGTPAGAGATRLVAVMAHAADGELSAFATDATGGYPSLTPDCPEAQLFEREIAEQCGLRPEGHPWLKPVRFPHTHLNTPQGPHAGSRQVNLPAGGPVGGVCGETDFFRVEGEEVHEVAVGPVHAGIIEPGHFRFQCHGENVYHLEISLGYQHRGVERAMLGWPNPRTIHYMETLAGDTTIGHVTAYCQAVEALLGCHVPPRAHAIRGLALELERCANHVGDLGALAGDVGYLPTMSYCGRLRGDLLNMTAAICGNRFGRGLVRPGGVAWDIEPARAHELLAARAATAADLASAVNLLWSSPSVMDRFEGTGTIDRRLAMEIGLVGPATRACGLERDVRRDMPSGIYQFCQIPVSTWDTGDVFARAYVRWLEVQHSMTFIRDQLASLPTGEVMAAGVSRSPGELGERLRDRGRGRLVVSMVEGWRGEICHVAQTGPDGRFCHYKVVDPSFHNWFGLALALRGQQVSDFPLCNKSFNLSYCGHDL